MSWSTSVNGTRAEIERKVSTCELPEHSDKSDNHKLQLHLAKQAAFRILDHNEFSQATSIYVGMSGHDYQDATGTTFFSVGANVTVQLKRVNTEDGHEGISTDAH